MTDERDEVSNETASSTVVTEKQGGLAAEILRKEATLTAISQFRDEFFSFLSAVAPVKEIDEPLLSRFSNLWIAVDDLALHHEVLVQRLADSHRSQASLRQIIWSLDPSRLPEAEEARLKSSGDAGSDGGPHLSSPKEKKKKKQKKKENVSDKSGDSLNGKKSKSSKDRSKGASTPDLHGKKPKRQPSSSKRGVTDSNLYAFSQQTSDVVVDLSSNREELVASAKQAVLEQTQKIFSKEVALLPIEKDIPRLIRGVTINGMGFGEWTAALADCSPDVSPSTSSSALSNPSPPPSSSSSSIETDTQPTREPADASPTTPSSADRPTNQQMAQSKSLPNVSVLSQNNDSDEDNDEDNDNDELCRRETVGESGGIDGSRLCRSIDDGEEDGDSTPDQSRWQRTALSQRPRHGFVRFGSATSLARQMLSPSSRKSQLGSVSSTQEESTSSSSPKKAVKFDDHEQVPTLDLSAVSVSESQSSFEESTTPRPEETKVDPMFLAQLHGFFIDLCVALGESPDFCKHVASTDLLDSKAESMNQGKLDESLKRYVADVLGSAPLVITVLKLMTQSLVAPAIVALKEGMMLLPFNSIPASWKVDIAVSRNEISIRHTKSEESAPGAIDRFGSFRFSWFVELLVDRSSGSIAAVNTGLLRFECDLAIEIRHRLTLEQIVQDLVELGCAKETQRSLTTRINLLVMEKSPAHKSKSKPKSRAVSYVAF